MARSPGLSTSSSFPSSWIVSIAEEFVKNKFASHDVSHDWHHLHRVRLNALRIAASLSLSLSLPQGDGPSSPPSPDAPPPPPPRHDTSHVGATSRAPDLVVVEVAALLHDLCDRKYLPPAAPLTAGAHAVDAHAVLRPLWHTLQSAPGAEDRLGLTDWQRHTVEEIVDQVSWSKDVARRERREQRRARRGAREVRGGHPRQEEEEEQEQEQEREENGEEEEEEEEEDRRFLRWEASCPEFWCVADADRLDAIGSIGILRCAAYSAVKSRPLHLFPAVAGQRVDGQGAAPIHQQGDGSCLAHFDEKLLKIHSQRLYTPLARAEAEQRQKIMRLFLEQAEREQSFCLQPGALPSTHS